MLEAVTYQFHLVSVCIITRSVPDCHRKWLKFIVINISEVRKCINKKSAIRIPEKRKLIGYRI